MKKGSVSIVVLVIGVLAVCVFSLISFVSSNRSYASFASDVSAVEIANMYAREISFHLKRGESPEKIIDIFDGPKEIGDYFFEAEKKEEGVYVIRAYGIVSKGGFLGIGSHEAKKFYLEKSVLLE